MIGTEALQPASLDAGRTDQSLTSAAREERGLISLPLRTRRPLVWHTERHGVLAVEAHGLRLVVHKWPGQDEEARFMVLRRQVGRGSPFALVASGGAADVRTAMAVAEDRGCRCAGLDPEAFASGAAM